MPKKILVIDDEELLTRTLVILLKKKGYDAFFVKSGDDAIEIVKEIDFDLVITDMRMPGKNGYETLKGIRQATQELDKKNPPEIIVTGYADPELEREVKELKPAVYLHKPFDVNELMSRIEDLVK